MYLGKGDRYGWCLRWSHDDRELDAARPGFDPWIKALTDEIRDRERATLEFLGISL